MGWGRDGWIGGCSRFGLALSSNHRPLGNANAICTDWASPIQKSGNHHEKTLPSSPSSPPSSLAHHSHRKPNTPQEKPPTARSQPSIQTDTDRPTDRPLAVGN